jgi:hypothetical protein
MFSRAEAMGRWEVRMKNEEVTEPEGYFAKGRKQNSPGLQVWDWSLEVLHGCKPSRRN